MNEIIDNKRDPRVVKNPEPITTNLCEEGDSLSL